MCTTITMYIAICLCQFIAASDTSIKWDVKTKSVIYGKETSLTCNGQTCSPHSSKQWIGGPSYDLLCSEDYTANRNKYEMVVQSTSFYFDLMIKNFTFDDANCKYTCVCGLHQYTKMLELDSLEFIYPPYLEKDYIVTKGSKVQVDLLMQVFPLPTCMLSYQESVIPLNISDYATKYEHGDYFKLFEVRIFQIYEMDHLSCKGSLNLSCTVGSRNYTPIETTIDFCTKDQNDLIYSAVVVGIVIFCLCGLGIIAWCTCKFVRGKLRHSRNKSHDVVDYNMTESTKNARQKFKPFLCSTDIEIPVRGKLRHSRNKSHDVGDYNMTESTKNYRQKFKPFLCSTDIEIPVIRKFRHSRNEFHDVGDYNMTESTVNANEEMEPICCNTDRIDIDVPGKETPSLFQVDDNG